MPETVIARFVLKATGKRYEFIEDGNADCSRCPAFPSDSYVGCTRVSNKPGSPQGAHFDGMCLQNNWTRAFREIPDATA